MPIMIGLSEGERKFVGLKQAVALVKSFREEYGLPVFLNPDHSHSVESAKLAYDAGFDSVHIDLSKLSFEENIEGAKKWWIMLSLKIRKFRWRANWDICEGNQKSRKRK